MCNSNCSSSNPVAGRRQRGDAYAEKNMRKFAVKSRSKRDLPYAVSVSGAKFFPAGTWPGQDIVCECVCTRGCACWADNNPKVLQAKRATITWTGGQKQKPLASNFHQRFFPFFFSFCRTFPQLPLTGTMYVLLSA